MGKHKDGDPAFPRAALGEDCGKPYGQQEGMSLRDWFAGQALAGQDVDTGSPGTTAAWAYRIADAMLAAREYRE